MSDDHTFLLMTMALAVAMVACQGAVGKTGETGDTGPPGPPGAPPEPVNLAPIPTPAFQPLMLMDEGAAKTVDVEPHFHDPEGETLTFDASAAPAGIIDVSRAGSVLTVTPVAAGEAVITVTATDPKGAVGRATINVTVTSEGIMYVGTLDTSVALMPGQQHMIPGATIEMSFEEDEGETLSFSVSSSDDAVAMAEIGDDSMVTITALDAVGSSADVTITAMDDEGETAEVVITVSVVASLAPQASDMAPDPVSLTAGGDAATVNASDYFSDPAGDDLDYEAESDDDTVATADEADGVVTIMPVSSGSATVTITATNSRGLSAMQTVDVTVMAAPVAMPTVSDDIEDVLFQSPDAAAQTIMLSDHFTGAAEYSATSSNSAVATATEAGGVLTVTPVGAGNAVVTVMASNASGMVSDEFVVNVLAAAMVNQPPMLKAGMTLGPFKGIVASFENVELNDYFVDPDGNSALISYDTEVTSESPTTDPTPPAEPNVIAVRGSGGWGASGATAPALECTATVADGTGSTAIPDGSDIGEDMLGICFQEAGMAEISIVAIDSLGARSAPVTVMVTVGANRAPTAVPAADPLGLIVDVDTARLKVGDVKKVIDNKTISEYFLDGDFPSQNADVRGDTLTFEVKSYPGTVADTALFDTAGDAVAGAPDPLASDKAQVSADISPKTWDGNPNSKFTLTLTGERGSSATPAASETVAIIATDEFGKSAVRVFAVRVNHRPQPYGAQADEDDRTTLGKYEGFMNLSAATTFTSPTLTLIDTNAGYFSDKDADTLTCDFRTSEHNVAAADRTAAVSMAANVLTVDPLKIGTMHIDVWCNDTFEDSDTARVMVEVDRGASIQ